MAHIAAREMAEAILAVQHAQHLDAQKPYLPAETVPAPSATPHAKDKSVTNQTVLGSTPAVTYVPLLFIFPDAVSSIDANTLKVQLALGLDPAFIRNIVLSANEDRGTTDNLGLSMKTKIREVEDKEMADALLHMLAIPKHVADRIAIERSRSLLQTNEETNATCHAVGTGNAKKESEKAVTGYDRNREKQAGSLQRGLSWAKTWLKQRNVKL